MKFLTHMMIVLLIGFLPSFAMAKDKTVAPTPSSECTLKNKVFCGHWSDKEGFDRNILGDVILFSNAKPSREDCVVIDEFVDKRYPYSVLKCAYYDNYLKKNVTGYDVFYITESTRKRDEIVPELLHASHNWEVFLSELCSKDGGKLICDPEKGSRELISRDLKQ